MATKALKRPSAAQTGAATVTQGKKIWGKPWFLDIRLGFEITLYCHTR